MYILKYIFPVLNNALGICYNARDTSPLRNMFMAQFCSKLADTNVVNVELSTKGKHMDLNFTTTLQFQLKRTVSL